MGIDLDPTGNTTTSLGPTDSCISVSSGQTFDFDIVIANVTDLAGWQLILTYDPAVLTLASADVDMFVTAHEGARLVDLSDSLPDNTGTHGFIVGDVQLAGQSGSGTLARVTAQVVGPGSAALAAEQVVLGDVFATSIDDADGDTFFDGPVSPAFVYVDASCPGELPSVTPRAPQPTVPILVFTPEPTIPGATVAPSPAGTAAPAATTPAVAGQSETEETTTAFPGQ
jgi:hypothetical protein